MYKLVFDDLQFSTLFYTQPNPTHHIKYIQPKSQTHHSNHPEILKLPNKLKASTALSFILALLIGTTLVIAADDLQTKCSSDFTKVTSCLSFVTAKANTPTKECCTAVTEIRKDDPACLCYFIQMANNGSVEQVKSLGIKVSQLTLLPPACKLANSNISECPTLLGLPANSPAAQVFTNLTTPTTSATGGTSTTAPTTAGSGNDSAGLAAGLDKFVCFMIAMLVSVSMSVFALA